MIQNNKREDSSFCEQKEAKKLWHFAAEGQLRLQSHGQNGKTRTGLCSDGIVAKVFLLPFVHKKKTSSAPLAGAGEAGQP